MNTIEEQTTSDPQGSYQSARFARVSRVRSGRSGFAFVGLLALTLTLSGCWDDGNGSPTATTYALGGSVTGLTTSGLVLANGSDVVTVASSATNFSFPSALASGSIYAVTVQTQPANATCAVSSASGTIGNSAVTSVSVACTPRAFVVSGSITGLGTSGLVLVNGTDTVSLAAGATGFVLPTPVAQGASYTVTVQAQPSGEHCSLTNSTGTIAGANISNVAVTCAATSHSLGGTISGLSTANLVLANGGDTVSPVAGALAFTFAMPVAEGGPYAVSVRTQPLGSTCSVGNGSGTIGSADVTSVQVTCSPTSFNVGGAISGLTTSGLILANGTDVISPAANATRYVLPHQVAFGGTYSVTVQQQPAGLQCNVAGTYPATISAGDVTTADVTCAPVSGLSLVVGQEQCPAAGYIPGTGAAASVPDVEAMAFDASGTLYFTGSSLKLVGKVTPSGSVSTLAGTYGHSGTADGTGATAAFNSATGIAYDGLGSLYVVDSDVIRKVTSAGVVTTFASQSSNGVGFVNGTGAAASFHGARGIAVDAAGNAYIGDSGNNAVRKMTPSAVVTTLAGDSSGSTGFIDGTGSAARFSAPTGVVVDAAGNVYTTDTNNYSIRKISPAGVVTTLAGSPTHPGFADGTGSAASFGGIQHLVLARGGGLYVLDSFYGAIRLVSPAGVVTTIATTVNFPPPTGPISVPSIHLPLANGLGPLAIFTDASGTLYLSIGCAIEKAVP